MSQPDNWGYPRRPWWYNVFDDPIPMWALADPFARHGDYRLLDDRLSIWKPIVQFALDKGYIDRGQYDYLIEAVPIMLTLELLED